MSICPNCKKPNESGASQCSECRHPLSGSENISGTIDIVVQAIDAEDANRVTVPANGTGTQDNLDFETDFIGLDDPTKKTATTIDAPYPFPVTRSGTVVSQNDLGNPIDRTVIGNDAGLAPEATIQQSPNIDATIDKTVIANDGPLPLDATIYLSDQPAESLTDAQATLLFDTNNPRELRNDQTIVFGTEGTDHATFAADGSGTQGRLKRMWEGAVGSSANPMHSLSAVSLQASDSIFERVATRKVLDANVPLTPDADYKIINKLGEGAMGIVYTARQTTVDRLVALKTAKPKFQKNEDARRRFLYEAQITADLDHSNIVPIHELGSSEDGMLFYSMKIVQGDQWSRVMAERTREQNLDIFMKVADAVAFAHSKGIIHRDLKPENTMLGLFGEVFVTDWGTAINLKKDSSPIIAAATPDDRRISIENTEHFRSGDSILIVNDDEVFERNEVGGISGRELLLRKKLSQAYSPGPGLRVIKAINMAGTPCYMAPEMAGHQLNRLGRCSDIYVLGGILFDMITGRPPHSGPTVTHCLKNALENEIVPPEAVMDDALLKIAIKAMSSKPEDRYQSVSEMQDAIRQYRRHAESISLANRSFSLLQNARATSDYEMFSRSLFGFRDAIELWPENLAARSGLAKARREFGEVAYGKGDYDLVLQTVDRSHESENEMYERAVQAKQRRVDRELRLKKLQRAVIAIVLTSVVGLSGLSVFAFYSRNLARLSANDAREKRILAETSKLEADKAKLEAEFNAQQAEESAKEEKRQRGFAEEEKAKAEKATREAEQSALAAKKAEREATAANELAQTEKRAAIVARSEADKQRDLAEKRAIEIQLDEYKSSLPLAKSQLTSLDVRAARENLARLESISDNFAINARPSFDTWAWQRINLLSNADLPRLRTGRKPVSSAGSRNGGVFALATDDGHIHVMSTGDKEIHQVSDLVEQNVDDFELAISNDGRQLAFAYSGSQTAGIKYWPLHASAATEIVSANGHRVQALAFSPDGRTLVAGINAGVWVWKLDENWASRPEPFRKIEKVRGTLVNIQAVSPTQFLMTIDFQNKREVRLLDIAEVTNHEIKVPDNLQSPIAQVLLLEGGQQIAIALADNRLAIASFDVGSLSLSNITVLENRHTATITNLRQDLAGRLISSSNAEPAAQVWQHTQGQWLHLTALSGLANNLENVLILDHNQTVGIDTSGECLLWDIDRQLQRSRMHRIDKDREQDRYVAPVQQLALGKFDGQALAIDANGVIDRWSLRDGASTTINGPRFSYIGHTPGAELVDCTVDTNGKFVVTAARLQNSQRQYLADPNATWEFCVWDTQSSTMLRRWTQSDIRADATRQTSGIEPRLSLLDQGRKLLIASDAQTRIVDLLTGQDAFVKNGFGTNFAVPCPVQDSLTLLVKRSGAIRFLDLNDMQAWNSQRVADDALRAAGDTPLKAVWTHDGKRIYMIYASGNVVQLDYNSGQIQIKWDSRAVDASVSHNSWMQALTPRNGRAASYLDIDLVVSTNAAGDQLQYAIRSGGIKSQTKHITIDFPLSSSPSLVASELVDGIHWLQHRDHEVPILVAKLNDSFEVDSQRVKVWHRSGPHTFVSSRAAQTYVMTDGRRDIQQFGRAPLRSAVGDSTGRTIYALLTDGSVWKFSLNTDNTSQWTKLEVDSSNATALTLSSDGRFLALNSPQAVEVWDVTNQSIVKRLDSAIDVVWDPRDANQKAACFPDGTLTVYDASWNVIKTISHKMQQDESVVGIQFYSETWTDPNQSPRRHLMLQTRNSSSDLVSFHAIDPPPVSSSDLEEMASAVVTAIPRNCRIVASPREGIFIVGTENGTVNVWFCMPSWGAPRQLYELVGHRGAVITAMKFTTDGKTLVTADDKNRLYAWLSQDPISN